MELQNKAKSSLKRKCSDEEISTNNGDGSQMTVCSVISGLGDESSTLRHDAYLRMLQNTQDQGWGSIPLISTNDNYQHLDEEL